MRGKRARSSIGLALRRVNLVARATRRCKLEVLESRHLLFASGNIVVERAGDGGLPNSSAQPLVLQEYTAAANQVSPVSSVGLPAATSGANNQGWVTDSASAVNDGFLHRSGDGRYLTLVGYDAILGTGAVTGSDSTTVNRNVARIDGNGNVSVVARLTDAYTLSAGNVRSAVSTDGLSLWIGGGSSTGLSNGLRYASAAASVPTTSVQVAGGMMRDVGIYGGILFAATAQTLASYGALPTTATAGALLPGVIGLSEIGGFVFFDRSPSVGATGLNGLDTLYVNDGIGTGTSFLKKFEWNAATSQWVARGSVTNIGGLFALTGLLGASTVQLYATSGLGQNNKLMSFTDAAAFGSDISGSFVTLAQAGTNYVFRGVSLAPSSVGPEDTLRVTSFQWNASGFEATFNRAPDLSVLNLYDSRLDNADASPGAIDPSDVTLVGVNTGNVRGSMAWDGATNKLTFVKTGGILAPDTYAATLFSRNDGFKAASGVLDGDSDLNDNELNDNYVATTTVAASNARVLSIHDVARGPGQTVDDGAAGPKLAVRISDATNVTKVFLRVGWDSPLLGVITNSPNNSTTQLALGLPQGWSLTIDPAGNGVVLIAQGTTPLSGNDVSLFWLQAIVPSTATLGATDVLRITNVSINDGAIAGVGDYAVHAVSYLGDVDGNKLYTGYDSALIARVAQGLDTGFNARSWIDPAILASVSGGSMLTGNDALLVAQKSVGLPNTQISDIPAIGGSGSVANETPEPIAAPATSSVKVSSVSKRSSLYPVVLVTTSFAPTLAETLAKPPKATVAAPLPFRTLVPRAVDAVFASPLADRPCRFSNSTPPDDVDRLQSIGLEI
jgi:hypothetical protein